MMGAFKRMPGAVGLLPDWAEERCVDRGGGIRNSLWALSPWSL